jgi:nicotinic acid mononucleotide adenylyltransferase
MIKPKVGDTDNVAPGSSICLLIGRMDPPTLDHLRALDAIFAASRFAGVWMCPLSGGESGKDALRAMAQISCVEYCSMSGKQVGCCSVAVDKGIEDPEELLAECKRLFPFMNFSVAMVRPDVSEYEPDYVVCLNGQSPTKGAKILTAGKFVPAPEDIREKIAGGSDQSRSFPEGVWVYIQKNRLYR